MLTLTKILKYTMAYAKAMRYLTPQIKYRVNPLPINLTKKQRKGLTYVEQQELRRYIGTLKYISIRDK